MARIGQGATLEHSTDGVTYTALAKLTEIGEFGLGEADDIDVTNHDSADGYREFIRGLVDPGDISFTGQWEASASQELPMTGANTGIANGPTTTLDYFKIVLPDSLGTWTGRGYWKSFTLNPQMDGLLEFSGSIKVSGKPSFTA
jgi:predicted secreted protein